MFWRVDSVAFSRRSRPFVRLSRIFRRLFQTPLIGAFRLPFTELRVYACVFQNHLRQRQLLDVYFTSYIIFILYHPEKIVS